MVVLSLLFVLFITFYPNLSRQDYHSMDVIYLDGRLISESLMSPGYPQDWTVGDVQRIGIMDRERLNTTKLAQFSTVTQTDYSESKRLFGLTADFAVFFTEPDGTVVNISGIHHVGHPDVAVGPGNELIIPQSEDLASFTRIVLMNGTMYNMVVYTWM
jgi:hypothetical protein